MEGTKLVKDTSLVEINSLDVRIEGVRRVVHPLQSVSFAIGNGARTGLVGESGSGKSMTALAMLRILPAYGRITNGSILFDGQDLVTLSNEQMRKVRGRRIGLILQNARAALNPVFSVGQQIVDLCQYHEGSNSRDGWKKAVEMLEDMGIPRAAEKARQYPHQYSGGMAQRAMIAMALVCSPDLLIADEPTTGLDVTIEEQVLDLIVDVVQTSQASLLLISHDIGVIRQVCTDVVVMYAGKIMETGPQERVLSSPSHPYTQALMNCFETYSDPKRQMEFIRGRVPDLADSHAGCAFADRCPHVERQCREEIPVPVQTENGRWVACHFV